MGYVRSPLEVAPMAGLRRKQRSLATNRTASTRANVCPEMVMPPDNRPIYARIIDLRMMLLFGRGRICTEQELRKLFGGVGLNPSRIQ